MSNRQKQRDWPLGRKACEQLARTDLCFVETMCQIGFGDTPDELASLTRIHQEAAAKLLECQCGRGDQ